MRAWQERGGGMATAEFEDGKLEEGYRRNVVSCSMSLCLVWTTKIEN